MPAALTRSISLSAISALVRGARAASGTPAHVIRAASLVHVARPRRGKEQPQSDQDRHLAPRQGERHHRLAVALFALRLQVLRRHPDRVPPLLGQARVVGVDTAGKVLVRRRMRRDTVVTFCSKYPGSIIAMEACCGVASLSRPSLGARKPYLRADHSSGGGSQSGSGWLAISTASDY